MLSLQTKIEVAGITAEQIFHFLTNPTDSAYQRWWPGTHFRFHVVERRSDHLGDVVYMDERVGARRWHSAAVVEDVVHPSRVVWQFKKLVRLPVRLRLELADTSNGVSITHTVAAGFRGVGRVFDPLLRLYFSTEFARALDDHVRTEFPLLRDRFAELVRLRGTETAG